ncbi:helix-turn-helix domain-containing protein [Paenibacillus sp. MBLB4367]|uniref:response regulator transcription factor n=1 Tax=Paenibacillus sp. MBLB4367 TaxID=3384767 RepID=UPI003907FD1F
MIKVLVVDDDKLARRGIIAEMPWDAFGMKVVGEANNGERALEFLRNEEVDLLITDLAMPVMSGLDLMREVQRLYPPIWFVVLTFHQDFELIQEALRIGAIDYIAKTQIENTRMEEVLGRISERIRRNLDASRPTAGSRTAEPLTAADSMLVCIAEEGQADLGPLWQCPFMQGKAAQEISLGMWSVPLEREMTAEAVSAMKRELVERGLDRQITVLHLHGARGAERDPFRKRLLQYKERSLFYEHKPEVFYYVYSAEQLPAEYPGWSDEELRTNRDAWSSLQWIVRFGVFEELLQEIGRARPSVAQLESLFYTAAMNWLRIAREEVWAETGMPGAGSYWTEWASWLNAIRGKLRGIVLKSAYSQEITSSIMTAVDFINRNLDADIRHSDLAKEANMSKGYFSQCFKEMIGQTFHDYIRDARIENARLLLAETKQPIYLVAEQCGYPNEKYFSRVFRERMGMLPSEYRQTKTRV